VDKKVKPVSFVVRKQTRDIASMLRITQGRSQYFMFTEDDMKLCPQGLSAIRYALQRVSISYPDWLAIRMSFGMNGILMKGGNDIETFTNYLIKHQARRPPDHLVVEWFAGETAEAKEYKRGRAHVGFKYNIMNHLGAVSTLRSALSPAYPTCYDLLVPTTVFEVESYDMEKCPLDCITPCDPPIDGRNFYQFDWGLLKPPKSSDGK
jgi:hypothetical protein